MNRYIIAIDPGKKTGMASLMFEEDGSRGTFISSEGSLLKGVEWLEGVSPILGAELVIEDFIYTAATAQKSRQTWSTEGIGMVRYVAYKYGLDFTIQAPVSAKKFSTDDKLKKIGWYFPSKGGHQNDAARHLLLYCVNQKLIDPRELI
jgi:hypothetical protein